MQRFGDAPAGLSEVLIGGRDIGEALVDSHTVALVSATGEALTDQPGTADGVQALHARGVRADTGDDQAVRLARGVRVRRHLDMGADPLKRALGRAQVAGAIVKYDDACHDVQVSRSAQHPASPV